MRRLALSLALLAPAPSLNHPVAYEVMPGATAKSILSGDDPVQRIGAFSEHQFWVTRYNEAERYAAGAYPTSSDATDGLAVWTKANRTIENTDIVGWYTLAFTTSRAPRTGR